MFSPEVAVKKQSEEEFDDPSRVHDLPDRTPGEILYLRNQLFAPRSPAIIASKQDL
jgi:hypothetical protein